jgi:GNAT superfamily N-acetyltransferase
VSAPAGIALRRMSAAELDRIAEIDRSEHLTHLYEYRHGVLASRPVDVAVPSWPLSGDPEHSVPGRVAAWRPLVERGGTLLGAFDADSLAGFAIYRPRLCEDMGNLAVLHVSRRHRGHGVGALLVGEVARLARADGARRLYVSATPTGATVEFYLGRGFQPTDQPDAALFALEPEDIHMVLEL